MEKIKIGIIFGGKSNEHDVSIVSGTSVIESINKKKYDVFPIYIDKFGSWFSYNKNIDKIKAFSIGKKISNIVSINNIYEYISKLDVLFPVLHGNYGEDGKIQGLFEAFNIPYVGCGVFSSSLCMNKKFTKIIIEKTKIRQAKSIFLSVIKNKISYMDDLLNIKSISIKKLDTLIKSKLKYPVFIKPSNSGSSVGINKAYDYEKLKKYVFIASEYDNEVIIEECIEGIEVECSILENNGLKVSTVGQIISSNEFYDYEGKYKSDTSRVIVPALIDEKVIKKIRELSLKIFKCLNCKGLARVDFFIDKNNNIIFNEINTMPGFTSISMYPKLWEYEGISFSELIDILIKNSINY